MKNYTGETLNNELLEEINKRCAQIFADGKSAVDNNTEANYKNYGTDKYVLETDEEEYLCLMELANLFLSFKETPANEIYDLPNLKAKIGGEERTFTLNVKVSQMESLANLAKKYERVFDKSIKLSFPSEVFQCLDSSVKVPNAEYYPPKPKLVSETKDEYEKRIEEYYKMHGVEKEMRTDKEIRKPYPHEQVDYRNDPSKIEPSYESSYYSFQSANAKKIKPAKPKNTRAEAGEPIVVTSSEALDDIPLSNGVGHGIKGIFGSLKNPDARKKVKYALIVTAAAALGITLVANVPIVAASLPAVGIYGLYRYLKKRKGRKKAPAEPEDEPEIPTDDEPAHAPEPTGTPTGTPTREPAPAPRTPTGTPTREPAPVPHGTGGEDGGAPTGTPAPATPPTRRPRTPRVPAPTPTIDVDLEAALRELNIDVESSKSLDNEILITTNELQSLEPTPENAERIRNLQEKLNSLNNERRQYLLNLQKRIAQIYNGYGLNQGDGGPTL